MAKEISKQELVAEIKRLGGKASIKERKEDLKCKLEDLKNERWYEKYGRPTENAMENETQKCIDNIIASMTKKEEEKNMTTETTIVAENTTPATETTNKEEKNMNQNTVFTPATDRLPETTEKYTVYGMTEWTAPAPKKTRKPSKLTAVRENVLEAFLSLLPSTPWTYTTRNKKPVLDLRLNDGKKIMVIIRYSNRGVQVMSKVEFPGSETHEKWSHPYAVMAKTAEDAIQTLTAIRDAIDQQEAEKKAKAEAEKKEEPKAE